MVLGTCRSNASSFLAEKMFAHSHTLRDDVAGEFEAPQNSIHLVTSTPQVAAELPRVVTEVSVWVSEVARPVDVTTPDGHRRRTGLESNKVAVVEEDVWKWQWLRVYLHHTAGVHSHSPVSIFCRRRRKGCCNTRITGLSHDHFAWRPHSIDVCSQHTHTHTHTHTQKWNAINIEARAERYNDKRTTSIMRPAVLSQGSVLGTKVSSVRHIFTTMELGHSDRRPEGRGRAPPRGPAFWQLIGTADRIVNCSGDYPRFISVISVWPLRTVGGVAQWSGRRSLTSKLSLSCARSMVTDDHFQGKLSAIGQPTRPSVPPFASVAA